MAFGERFKIEDISLCADMPSGIPFAIQKASQLAKQLDQVIYIYSNGIFFHATTNYLKAHKKEKSAGAIPVGEMNGEE